ncbi:MAG: RNA chaperone ProQ [Paraglaciecola sp.]|uniref:RNA chaperone ProQ n=1 Tax=Paraglaciecola sp. TaxID=1920173 RepID=UPI00273EA311|nr:RNA chaperone ProQ [Paraglaciecola sp.]MDP5031090.1 RNA chaperone ProQ [Paraglaciecola sp.]MDP5041581.1 RNA chaperone ProQ [Paraglaciecola sp.]MDP5132400.1 RNA chaperone ProQ [Paraglaciecola sp.]
MDTPQKFSNSKEVLAFLAETFPACFSIQGQAKPLKIGIFQDLAQRLDDEERVSKTLLRSSLRHYTNSWRYLQSIVEGQQRVDLDGNDVAVIEKDHAEHAKKQLDESRALVAEKRKEQQAKKPPAKKSYKNKEQAKPKSVEKPVKKPEPAIKLPPAEKLSAEHLVVGTLVTVKIGKTPMPASITDVNKDGVQVQLDTGMVVKVQVDNLRLARAKR